MVVEDDGGGNGRLWGLGIGIYCQASRLREVIEGVEFSIE